MEILNLARNAVLISKPSNGILIKTDTVQRRWNCHTSLLRSRPTAVGHLINVKFKMEVSFSRIITHCNIQIALRPSSANLCVELNHCRDRGAYFASGSDMYVPSVSPRRGAAPRKRILDSRQNQMLSRAYS